MNTVAPNIFKPRNDWNVRSFKCKKRPLVDVFERLVAREIEKAMGVHPLSSTAYRKREYVESRQLFLTMMHNHTKRSLASIGSIVGKDHATVLHSVKTINNLCDTDKKFREMYEFIENRVKQLN